MKSDRKAILIIVVVLVLGALGLFAYRLTLQPDQTQAPTSVDTTRNEIIAEKADKVSTKTDITESQAEIEQGGGETRADLMSKATGEASGTVIRNVTGGGTSFVVSAKLPVPELNDEYQAWLIGENAKPRVIPMGNLGRAGADQFVATYSSNEDLSAYTIVVVSSETEAEAGDEEVGTQVLEATLE